MDEENKQFIEHVNPHALKDMAGRMLEAIQQSLWKAPVTDMEAGLQQIVLQSE